MISLKARDRSHRLSVINSYIVREQARPEAERFTVPALSEVIEVRDQLQASLAACDAGRAEREAGVVAGRMLARILLDYLQTAAVTIVARDGQFKVTPELEKWGFDVVAVHRNGNGYKNGQEPSEINGDLMN